MNFDGYFWNNEILGCRDPRYKHEYLDAWCDESDKHIKAHYRWYSCVEFPVIKKFILDIGNFLPFINIFVELITEIILKYLIPKIYLNLSWNPWINH